MRKQHVWESPACVRAKRHHDMTGESHPCYWCGSTIPVDEAHYGAQQVCTTCHGGFCPVCGNCLCNVSDDQYEALRVLRHKYCCNTYHFMKDVEPKDMPLLSLVPNFKISLDYCRQREGVCK